MEFNTKPNLRQFSPYKLLNHWDFINKTIEGKNLPPITCEIDLSNSCNHNCSWCTYGNTRKNELMPDEVFFPLLDELAGLGIKAILLNGGGEPSTHPAFKEMLYKIKEKGMEIGIISNGGLLDDELRRAIIDTTLYIRISLDAAKKETHNKIHDPKNPEKDNLDTILDNIKKLVHLRNEKKKNIEIGVGFLVSRDNYGEILEAARTVKETGADYIQIRPAIDYKDVIPKKQCTNVGAMQQFPESILFEIRKQTEEARKLEDESFRVIALLYRFSEIVDRGRDYDKCYAHCVAGTIGADCKVYLCCQHKLNPAFCIGDLRENTFSEIWNSKKRQDIINSVNVKHCPPCKNNGHNKIFDYLAEKDKKHVNFL